MLSGKGAAVRTGSNDPGSQRRRGRRTAYPCRCGRSPLGCSGPDCSTFLRFQAADQGRCQTSSLCHRWPQSPAHSGCRGRAPQRSAPTDTRVSRTSPITTISECSLLLQNIALRTLYSRSVGSDAHNAFRLGVVRHGGQCCIPGYYRQNIHHLFPFPSVRALVAMSWWSWSISLALIASSWSWASIRACNASTRSPLPVTAPVAAEFPAGESSISIFQVNPCGVGSWWPLSWPLRSRRLTVCSDTWRAVAASETVICMSNIIAIWVSTWVAIGYAVFRRFGEEVLLESTMVDSALPD